MRFASTSSVTTHLPTSFRHANCRLFPNTRIDTAQNRYRYCVRSIVSGLGSNLLSLVSKYNIIFRRDRGFDTWVTLWKTGPTRKRLSHWCNNGSGLYGKGTPAPVSNNASLKFNSCGEFSISMADYGDVWRGFVCRSIVRLRTLQFSKLLTEVWEWFWFFYFYLFVDVC